MSDTIKMFRWISLLEGLSFILLVFIAVPIKHIYHNPFWVRAIGPVHGLLFILFVFYSFQLQDIYQWKFKEKTWKVLLSGFLPFGTFYMDYKLFHQKNS